MTTNNSVNNSLTGQTGTGNFVGSTSPTLVTPVLGTPSSGNLVNCTGYAGNVTTTNTTSNTNYFPTIVSSSTTGNQQIFLNPSVTMNPGSGISAFILNEASAVMTIEGNGDKTFQLAGFSTSPTTNTYSVRNAGNSIVYVNTQNSIPLAFGVSTGTTGGSTVNSFQLTSTGAATFTGAIAAPSINFGGQTLSRYAVGSFTPTISFATPGDLAINYSTQIGNYAVIGNIALMSFTLAFKVVYTTASSFFEIGSFPFAFTNNAVFTMPIVNISANITYPTGTTVLTAFTSSGNTFCTVAASGLTNPQTLLTTAAFPSSGSVIYSLGGTIMAQVN